MTDTLIDPLVKRLQADFGLTPHVACEIEFYLFGAGEGDLEPFFKELTARCFANKVFLNKCERERGHEQCEIALYISDPVKAAADLETVKRVLGEMAIAKNLTPDFGARPMADRPGSGLHVHVHLADEKGVNMFHKDDETISDPLKYSIGGMLAWLPASMPVFAPNKESYGRYFVPGGQVPSTVSWGANNRTTALRLPEALHANKRIEHRVSGADANPATVIAFILAAMHYGLANRVEPGPQIYGDAALPVYNQPKLPASLAEALVQLQSSKLIGDYFDVKKLIARAA